MIMAVLQGGFPTPIRIFYHVFVALRPKGVPLAVEEGEYHREMVVGVGRIKRYGQA